MTLDYIHFTRQGVPDEDIEPLWNMPATSTSAARRDRLPASTAENTIDCERVPTCMEEIGYPGWHAVEDVWCDGMHCNECDNLSETILLRNLIRKHCTR